MASKKTGRKTKLSPQLKKRIVALLQKGHMIEIACNASGITAATFYGWMNRGEKEGSGLFFDFFKAVTSARGIAEVHLVDCVQKAALTDWRPATWLLERMFPDRYAGRERLDVTHKGSIEHKAIHVHMPAAVSQPRPQLPREPLQIDATSEPV